MHGDLTALLAPDVVAVDTFARYLIHDPVHHLDDVSKGFAVLGVTPATPIDG